jgi:hypothetical protein
MLYRNQELKIKSQGSVKQILHAGFRPNRLKKFQSLLRLIIIRNLELKDLMEGCKSNCAMAGVCYTPCLADIF